MGKLRLDDYEVKELELKPLNWCPTPQSSCLSFLGAGTTDGYHHPCFYCCCITSELYLGKIALSGVVNLLKLNLRKKTQNY